MVWSLVVYNLYYSIYLTYYFFCKLYLTKCIVCSQNSLCNSSDLHNHCLFIIFTVIPQLQLTFKFLNIIPTFSFHCLSVMAHDGYFVNMLMNDDIVIVAEDAIGVVADEQDAHQLPVQEVHQPPVGRMQMTAEKITIATAMFNNGQKPSSVALANARLSQHSFPRHQGFGVVQKVVTDDSI